MKFGTLGLTWEKQPYTLDHKINHRQSEVLNPFLKTLLYYLITAKSSKINFPINWP